MTAIRKMTETEMAEFEIKAAEGETLPDGLNAPERALFIALRGLYYQYRMNIMDREQAKSEKVQILNDYEQAILDEKCREKSRALWKQLPYDLMKCECEECRRLAKLILGLK